MGGHLGLKYVTTVGAPVSRLVITGSGPRFWQAQDAPYGTPADQVQGLVDAIRLTRTETIAAVYANNFHRTDLEATRQWFVQTGWKVPAFVGVSSFEAIVAEDLRAALPSIDIPVAVFSGRHDPDLGSPVVGAGRQGHPGGGAAHFENSGHVAFVEDRAEWNHERGKFIDSQ
jgi:pimeloyl-ACP methyl ester carboxylesterase